MADKKGSGGPAPKRVDTSGKPASGSGKMTPMKGSPDLSGKGGGGGKK